MTRITCLGAGSHSFGLSTLITLLQSDVLRGAEIALVDTKQESLDLISDLANWLNSEWDTGKLLSSHSSHKNALDGSDFVISAIEVQPRERLWRKDFELGSQYGLRQPYAENGGQAALPMLPAMSTPSFKLRMTWKNSVLMPCTSTSAILCTASVT